MVARSLVADDPIVFSLLVDEFLDDEDDGMLRRTMLDDEGESAPLSKGGFGNRLRNQLCFSAMFGVILCVGSHSRHRRMKSRKSGSLQPFSATCKGNLISIIVRNKIYYYKSHFIYSVI